MHRQAVINRLFALSLMLVCVVVAGVPTAVQAEESQSVADGVAQALKQYYDLNWEEGLKIAEGLLARDNLSPEDSIAIYEVMSIITYSYGEDHMQKAFNYLEKISKIGPCVLHLPRDIWPAQLRTKWFKMLNKTDNFTCAEQTKGKKSIAIMEFDNYSVGKYQEELGSLGKALSVFMGLDLAKVSDLNLIEREKTDLVISELKLAQSDMVDKANAVQVGKLLSAHYMVFGSITQLDSKHARMIVRVVDVETSEIVASMDREGKPDFVQMQKELVPEIVEAFDIELGDGVRKALQEGGTASMDATTLYATGLDYMDRYEYKQAYEYFKQAYDADPSFAEAKRKMEIYRPLAS